jgi:hypothetical protein
MSSPSLATKRPANASGTLVPAANSVRPITVSGMPQVSPITVTIQTSTYEHAAIHAIDIANVNENSWRQHPGLLQSGMVTMKTKVTGNMMIQDILFSHVSGKVSGDLNSSMLSTGHQERKNE